MGGRILAILAIQQLALDLERFKNMIVKLLPERAISLSLYIYIYFLFRVGLGIRSFQKNGTIFAFFSVFYKRTERSLHSFLFFIKKRNDLCVLFRSL